MYNKVMNGARQCPHNRKTPGQFWRIANIVGLKGMIKWLFLILYINNKPNKLVI